MCGGNGGSRSIIVIINTLVLVVVVVVIVTAVVVLDTLKPVAVVLCQGAVADPQFIQLLPQLVPLLLLHLLPEVTAVTVTSPQDTSRVTVDSGASLWYSPLPVRFIGGGQLVKQCAVHLHQRLQHIVDQSDDCPETQQRVTGIRHGSV